MSAFLFFLCVIFYLLVFLLSVLVQVIMYNVLNGMYNYSLIHSLLFVSHVCSLLMFCFFAFRLQYPISAFGIISVLWMFSVFFCGIFIAD